MKNKTPTCKDCIKYAVCIEHSRMYPCRDFKGTKRRDEHDNYSDNKSRL